jgi:hypothetical protein
MITAPTRPSDVAFTPAVKAIQAEKGSREAALAAKDREIAELRAELARLRVSA